MRFSRRHFIGSAGAGLLLAPFLSSLYPGGGKARGGATGRAKRLLLFCTMGTNPDIWTPTSVTGETSFTFSTATSPLAAIKQNIVLIEGCPSANPGDGHGAPDGLTGIGYGGQGQPSMISVDQFISDRLVAAGVNRPIPTLLLGAGTLAANGKNQFWRVNNLPTIASPLSAFNAVFGGMVPSGPSPAALLRRRRSILDLVSGEIAEIRQNVSGDEAAKLDLHLSSIRQIENRLSQTTAGGCSAPATPSDDTSDILAANLAHMDIIVSAFACDITRVAALEFGSDAGLAVNLPGLQGDQHNGFIHSGAPDYKNLIAFEQWLSQRFVDLVNKLKAIPEADGSGTLFDNTLVVWSRDMGDAVNHNQKSMRFVLAGGAGGYLKTDPNGRYLLRAGSTSDGSDRHERVLLNLCEAMGVTDFHGFGDPMLGSFKIPLDGVAA